MQRNNYPPLMVLGTTLLCIFLGLVIGYTLLYALAQAYGVEIAELVNSSQSLETAAQRNRLRLAFFINQLFTFLLPGFGLAWLLNRQKSLAFLDMDKLPLIRNVLLAVLFLGVLSPLVLASLQYNLTVDLPEWMVKAEDETNAIIEGLLVNDNSLEFIFNVLLIGVVPALGEEILFRGIFQKQTERILKNGHLAVWATAILFSIVHWQFQGFLPRMFLGAGLGYLFLWTRNLWIPIIAHFFNNTIQLVGHKLGLAGVGEQSELATNTVPWWALTVSIVGSIALGIYLQNINKKDSTN